MAFITLAAAPSPLGRFEDPSFAAGAFAAGAFFGGLDFVVAGSGKPSFAAGAFLDGLGFAAAESFKPSIAAGAFFGGLGFAVAARNGLSCKYPRLKLCHLWHGTHQRPRF